MSAITPETCSITTSNSSRNTPKKKTASIYKCRPQKIPKPEATKKKKVEKATPRDEETNIEKSNPVEKFLQEKARIYFGGVRKPTSLKVSSPRRDVDEQQTESPRQGIVKDYANFLNSKDFLHSLTWSRVSEEQLEEITRRLCRHTHISQLRESDARFNHRQPVQSMQFEDSHMLEAVPVAEDSQTETVNAE